MPSEPVTTSATPILDRQTPIPAATARSNRLPAWVTIGIWVGVLGGFFSSLLPSVLAPFGWLTTAVGRLVELLLDSTIVTITASIAVAIVAVVAIHEIGHVLAARLAGFRVHALQIFRLSITPPFNVSLQRRSSRAANGWVVCTPESMDRAGLRAAVVFAAGPVANLLSAALVWYLVSPAGAFAGVFIAWSAIVGVANLLPMRVGDLHTDGRRIVMLLFDRRRGERWLAVLALSRDAIDGASAGELSPQLLAAATSIEDDSSDTIGAFVFAYASALHRHEDDEAARCLEVCFRNCAKASEGLRHALIADAAAFQGRRRRRADLAAQWLADLPEKLEQPWIRRWAETGVLHARGDIEGALSALDDVEAAVGLQSGPLRGLLFGSLNLWRAELRAPVVVAATAAAQST